MESSPDSQTRAFHLMKKYSQRNLLVSLPYLGRPKFPVVGSRNSEAGHLGTRDQLCWIVGGYVSGPAMTGRKRFAWFV
jgi:hypothetical protein